MHQKRRKFPDRSRRGRQAHQILELHQIRAVFVSSRPRRTTYLVSYHILSRIRFLTRYFCAALGNGRRMTIIASSSSAALIQFCMERSLKSFPINCFSSPFRTMWGCLHHLGVLSSVVVHVRTHPLCERAHEKLAESTLKWLVTPLKLLYVRPCFFLALKVIVSTRQRNPIRGDHSQMQLSLSRARPVRHPRKASLYVAMNTLKF